MLVAGTLRVVYAVQAPVVVASWCVASNAEPIIPRMFRCLFLRSPAFSSLAAWYLLLGEFEHSSHLGSEKTTQKDWSITCKSSTAVTIPQKGTQEQKEDRFINARLHFWLPCLISFFCQFSLPYEEDSDGSGKGRPKIRPDINIKIFVFCDSNSLRDCSTRILFDAWRRFSHVRSRIGRALFPGAI